MKKIATSLSLLALTVCFNLDMRTA